MVVWSLDQEEFQDLFSAELFFSYFRLAFSLWIQRIASNTFWTVKSIRVGLTVVNIDDAVSSEQVSIVGTSEAASR